MKQLGVPPEDAYAVAGEDDLVVRPQKLLGREPFRLADLHPGETFPFRYRYFDPAGRPFLTTYPGPRSKHEQRGVDAAGNAVDWSAILTAWVDEEIAGLPAPVLFSLQRGVSDPVLLASKNAARKIASLHNCHYNDPDDRSSGIRPSFRPLFANADKVDLIVCQTQQHLAGAEPGRALGAAEGDPLPRSRPAPGAGREGHQARRAGVPADRPQADRPRRPRLPARAGVRARRPPRDLRPGPARGAAAGADRRAGGRRVRPADGLLARRGRGAGPGRLRAAHVHLRGLPARRHREHEPRDAGHLVHDPLRPPRPDPRRRGRAPRRAARARGAGRRDRRAPLRPRAGRGDGSRGRPGRHAPPGGGVRAGLGRRAGRPAASADGRHPGPRPRRDGPAARARPRCARLRRVLRGRR